MKPNATVALVHTWTLVLLLSWIASNLVTAFNIKHAQTLRRTRLSSMTEADDRRLPRLSAAKDMSGSEFDLDYHLDMLNSNLESRHSEGMSLSSILSGSEHEWRDSLHLSLRYALLSWQWPRRTMDDGSAAPSVFDGPVHVYANFGGLAAFSATRDQMLRIPATRLASPGFAQEDLVATLTALREDDESGGPTKILEDYSGFRCTISGDRFYVRDATIWNWKSHDTHTFGQAMLFDREKISQMN